MIQEIEYRLREWGAWHRKHADGVGWQGQSTLYRIMREGPYGAAIQTGYGPRTFDDPMPPMVADMDRAVSHLPEELRLAVVVRYADLDDATNAPYRDEDAARRLGVRRRAYQERIRIAQHSIAGYFRGIEAAEQAMEDMA